MRATPLELLIKVHKALAHPVRVRILAMLRGGELCVCQLNAVIGLAGSTMSAHLGELKEAGLVAERKESRWVHYRLAAEGASEEALVALWRSLGDDPQVLEDAALLARVKTLPVTALCVPGFDVSALGASCCSPRGGRRSS